MGIGFPKRLVRSALGPKLRNNYPADNPETDIPDAAFNATFWNVAGMGLVAPRAIIAASWNGSGFDIHHQAEAWNPNEDQAHPALARTATGLYTYTFASTYKDEDGTDVPTVLRAPAASVHADGTAWVISNPLPVDAFAWLDASNPLIVRIRIIDWAVNNADAPFSVVVR